ncbi:hypothetical protein QBC37DRAFT_313970 [Rhypophila decipiens]|uniref:BTB domain-containing protein n=1 Tax=Rhypophila decipiens TaxID=261697 RepID=A0AAN6Y8N3_9PEZI|nr:hypothetical protein QBC37DRAFT_313970 [Rhypophila decipiens]
MDSVWVVLVPSLSPKTAPIFEIDPVGEVLIVVPPPSSDSGQPATLYHHDGIRIKVSAKHLCMASPVFKAKLSHFHPSTATQPDGRIHLRLATGLDPKAVYLVFSALHPGLPTRRLPKQLDSIETLAQVAVVVDRLGLLDSVEVYAERWINRLWKGAVGKYSSDWALWVYVASVFGREDIFEAASRKVIEEHSGGANFEELFSSLDLPLHIDVIRTLETRHIKLLTNAVNVVNTLMNQLMLVDSNCLCGTSLLGTLVTALSKTGLLKFHTHEGSQKHFNTSYADFSAAIQESTAKFGSWRPIVPTSVKTNPLGINGINGKLPTPASSPHWEHGDTGFDFPEHTCVVDELIGKLMPVFAR